MESGPVGSLSSSLELVAWPSEHHNNHHRIFVLIWNKIVQKLHRRPVSSGVLRIMSHDSGVGVLNFKTVTGRGSTRASGLFDSLERRHRPSIIGKSLGQNVLRAMVPRRSRHPEHVNRREQ